MKLRIEKAIYGGAGLARIAEADGRSKAVFVPLTLPGETVEAHITEDKGSFANAALDAVLDASPERISPACQHFGICGGCHYQHANYETQLEMKRIILQETLTRAKLAAIPEIQIHPSAPWEYRNRIRLHIAKAAGQIVIGYYQRASHRIFEVQECLVAAPLLVKTVRALQSMAARGNALLEICGEVEFFCNAEETELQASFFTTQNTENSAQSFAALCEELKTLVPQLTGAGLFTQPQQENSRSKLIAEPSEIAHWGPDELIYTVDTTGYRVSRGAFFQVNRGLLASLRDLVTSGRSGKLAWDLYAGVGLFSVPLTENFSRVVAVESSAAAMHDLKHNLTGTQHQISAVTTLNFLRAQQTAARPDLIVLDPPRAGLGPEVCKLLGEIAAPELVYVSCDPATLSRDLAALVEFGYQLVHLHLFDLFPQTFHLETVAVLTREA